VVRCLTQAVVGQCIKEPRPRQLAVFLYALNVLSHALLKSFMDSRGSTHVEGQDAPRAYDISCSLKVFTGKGNADNETLPKLWLGTSR
jgi:hypothetical protein